MKVIESYSFKFQAQELPQKLRQLSQQPLTGYWLFEFPSLSPTAHLNSWYLGLCQGRVVFCAHQPLCWQVLFHIFQRYLPRFQNPEFQHLFVEFEQRWRQQQHQTPSALVATLLDELQQLHSLSSEDLKKALRLSLLSDFDTYMFSYSGQARFFPCTPLELPPPHLGFELEELVSAAKQRQSWWHQLHSVIPSLEHVPVLNQEAVNSAQLTSQQKLWLESVTQGGKTLNQIASYLAQDSLEIAKVFASLITKGLVKLKASTVRAHQELFVVDDSPLILKQFETLVKSWGYSVRTFHKGATVLDALAQAHPLAFFLDINMPEITGFDLVKQIRRQPQLATVPIIMLTAEQTLANNWRARWSGCQFLSKPLTPSDVPRFKTELRHCLSELLLEPPSQVEPRFGYQS